MRGTVHSPGNGNHPWWGLLIVTVATVIAVLGARSYAGGWNDGSRLAMVEALVDHHTLAIDQSIFVRVPSRTAALTLPYPADDEGLLQYGTGDKLYIRGHYYSDKSPVPGLLLAALYQDLQWLFRLKAAEHTDWFIYVLTLGSAGLAYVVAVWCVFRLGVPLRLELPLRLALAGSFALATLALPYSRHVNNHVLLLAVAAGLFLGLAWLARESEAGSVSRGRLAGLGTLAGLGYAIDLGTGPVLLGCTLVLVAYRCRQLRAVLLVALTALPWLAAHHGVNYAIGGTWRPANAVAEYLNWPGSIFDERTMTGVWNHDSLGHFLLYAGDLLVGRRGFLLHNLPVLLAVVGLPLLLRRRLAELPELLLAACWALGTWLVYALTSTNLSGQCCSIRWFVPLLAAGYYVLAVLLRQQPRFFGDFLLLSTGGVVMAGLCWLAGPWMKRMVPFYWGIVAVTLFAWLGYRLWHTERQRPARAETVSGPLPSARAA